MFSAYGRASPVRRRVLHAARATLLHCTVWSRHSRPDRGSWIEIRVLFTSSLARIHVGCNGPENQLSLISLYCIDRGVIKFKNSLTLFVISINFHLGFAFLHSRNSVLASRISAICALLCCNHCTHPPHQSATPLSTLAGAIHDTPAPDPHPCATATTACAVHTNAGHSSHINGGDHAPSKQCHDGH